MRSESRFLLDNDLPLIPPLLGHLRDNLVRSNLCDEHGVIRVSIALGEALMKAIVRGNLEIDPCLRDAYPRAFQSLIEERRREKPYGDRRVHVVAKELLHEARYVIRHEGPGVYVANPLAANQRWNGFLDLMRQFRPLLFSSFAETSPLCAALPSSLEAGLRKSQVVILGYEHRVADPGTDAARRILGGQFILVAGSQVLKALRPRSAANRQQSRLQGHGKCPPR